MARRGVWLAALIAFAWTREARAQSDDDLVEVLEDEPQGKPAAARPSETETKADKLEIRGFARTTLQLGLPKEGGAPRGLGAQRELQVGYERASSVNQLYVDARYRRGKSFQAVVSGSLAYTASLMEGRAGEAVDSREVENVLLEPMLREAYLGFFSERVDIRLGQQRIVWGNSEGATPNDILNARDNRNRLQLDPEMNHIPTIAARADFDLGLAVLGLVAQPFFTPNRTSLYGTNWALVQPDSPVHVRRFFGTYTADRDPAAIQSALVRENSSRDLFDGASAGTSLRLNVSGFDTSFYYYYGLDPTPFVYMDPSIAAAFQSAKSLANPTGQDFEVVYAAQRQASAAYGGPFVSRYIRRHHVGGDLSTTVGPVVLRLDTAFDSASVFYTKENLNSVARPTAQLVAGAEYQRGFGKAILVEASYMRLLGPSIPIIPTPNQANGGPLLFVNDDNVGLANVVRWTFFENLVVETRTFLGITPFSWVVRPEIGYTNTTFTARLGVMLIDGEGGSFGSFYRRNETLYATTRYSF